MANGSDAIIILTVDKEKGFMHYFAGIKQSDGLYIFYNSGLEDEMKIDIDGRPISISELLEYIELDSKYAGCLFGVKK